MQIANNLMELADKTFKGEKLLRNKKNSVELKTLLDDMLAQRKIIVLKCWLELVNWIGEWLRIGKKRCRNCKEF